MIIFRELDDKLNQIALYHVFNRAGKFEFSKFKFFKLFCLEHLPFGHLRLFRIGPAGRFARISCFGFKPPLR